MIRTETQSLSEWQPLPDGWELVERDGYRQLVKPGALEGTDLGWPRDDTDAQINITENSAGVKNPSKLPLTRTHQADPLGAAFELAHAVEEAVEEQR